MASVSSLDKDMRNIRLSKYTPQAANEVRTWIEQVLGESLAAGDLLEALKDGIALCKLVNLAAPPGVRFKQSSMPFVQMENISHFLRACQQPPLSLQSHDIFQTVDLYESKDPAQVLQCISSFSRRAHAVQPNRFSSAIGEKNKNGLVSPQSTGGFSAGNSRYGRPRGASNTSEASSTPSYQASQAIGGRGSPSRLSETGSTKSANTTNSSSGGVSSWSKRGDEGATTPAWNIHQYGYMGGASQGNQGITFGGRRQITTPAPKVPSLAEKERKRREQEVEADRLRLQAEEAEHRRRIEREEEEERERHTERQRREEEIRKNRLRIEEEKRQWDEEERLWKLEEEARISEEKEAEARFEKERANALPRPPTQPLRPLPTRKDEIPPQQPPRPLPTPQKSIPPSDDVPPQQPPRPLPSPTRFTSADEEIPPQQPPRRHPSPQISILPPATEPAPQLPRPLPNPATYTPPSTNNPPPSPTRKSPFARPSAPNPTTAQTSSNPVRKPPFAKPSSLLSREMELDRLRQQEWEEGQKATQKAAEKGVKEGGVNPGDGSWDTSQYGYLGGDSQNRAGPGIGFGGRRQLVGPREPPGRGR